MRWKPLLKKSTILGYNWIDNKYAKLNCKSVYYYNKSIGLAFSPLNSQIVAANLLVCSNTHEAVTNPKWTQNNS